MDELIFRPKDVKGGGNIISPSKTLNDFRKYNSKLTQSTVTIDNQEINDFYETYLSGSYFIATYNDWYDPTTTEITINATLKHITNTIIYGATVKCIVNDTITYTATTNQSGNVSFTIPCEDYYTYMIKLVYDGNNNVAGCLKNILIHIGDITNVDLKSQHNSIDIDESNWFLGTVTGVNNEGESIPVSYTQVDFYEAIGWFKLLDSMSVSCDVSGSNHCYSIGLDDLGLDLSNKDFTLTFDYTNTVNGGRLCLGAKNSWSEGQYSPNYYMYMGTSSAGNGGYGVRTTTTNNSSTGSSTAGDTLHCKIVKKGSTLTYYLNNVLKGTKTAEWISNYSEWSIYLTLWEITTTTVSNIILDIDPTIIVSSSQQQIGIDEVTSISAIFKDTIDGSRIDNELINLYAEYTGVPIVNLSTDKSIISSYHQESTILTATVTDNVQLPLVGETVTIKKDGVTFSEGVTDTNGQVTCIVQSNGDGDIVFTATSNDITSESLTIEDCIFYEGDEYTFTATDVPSNTDLSIIKDEDFHIALPETVEISMDVKTDITGARLQISSMSNCNGSTANYGFGSNRDSSGISPYYRTTSSNMWGTRLTSDSNYHNFKFIKNGNTVEAFVDKVSKGSKTFTWMSNYTDYTWIWWVWNSGNITSKNVKIK